MAASFSLDDGSAADLPAITAILNDAIRNTLAVWYEEEKTLAEMQAWFAAKQQSDTPVLVARDGDGVAGFASYGPFRPWPGYRFSVEHSVYVRPDARGRGIGKALLQALLLQAGDKGLHTMIGGIEAGNEASIRLHVGLGFTETGRIPEVGYKFGKWLTLVFMQKTL
jgi:phosphinothricin acetyltransferase